MSQIRGRRLRRDAGVLLVVRRGATEADNEVDGHFSTALSQLRKEFVDPLQLLFRLIIEKL